LHIQGVCESTKQVYGVADGQSLLNNTTTPTQDEQGGPWDTDEQPLPY